MYYEKLKYKHLNDLVLKREMVLSYLQKSELLENKILRNFIHDVIMLCAFLALSRKSFG